jgi:ribosomal protein S21
MIIVEVKGGKDGLEKALKKYKRKSANKNLVV